MPSPPDDASAESLGATVMETNAKPTGEIADVAGSDERPDRFHVPFLWTLAALLIAGLWLSPLTSSLWMDEAGTWWVISGGFHQLIQRAEAVQGESPLYYLLLWSWVHVAGHSEIALRLPSLVCSLATARIVYLIAKRFFDRETGRIAVIAFVVWDQVVFEASNARPYALGTLLATAAAWLLIDWLDRGRARSGIGFVLLAAMIPYAHPFLALIYLPYAIYVVVRIRDGSSAVSTRGLLVAAACVVVLVAPLTAQLIAIARRSDELNAPPSITLPAILILFIPMAIVATAVAVLVVAALSRITFAPTAASMSARVLLIGWFLIPTGTLILASMITSLQLLERRYFDVVAPAGAIIAGYLIRALGPAPIRRLIVMTLVILSVLSVADATKFGDLRGALALVSSQATDSSTTLLTVGFRESLHPSFSQDPERSSFLTAATLYYPVPGHVVAMPITSPALEYPTARAEVEEAIASSDQILVVTLAGSAYEPWLEEVFGRHGYTSHVVGVVEPYTVTEFTPP